MSDVVVFAGTTEGYEICSFLAKNKVSVLACVATDYGSKSLKEDEYLKIPLFCLPDFQVPLILCLRL